MPSLKAMAREAQKKAKASTPKQAPNRKQTVFKSTERVADSDLESETESASDSDSGESSAIVPVPVSKVNGQKPKPMAANIEVESEEGDKEIESEKQGDVVVSSNYSGASDKSSDRSESESNEDSDSGRESDEKREHGKAKVATENASSHMEEEVLTKSDKPRAIPIYNPPNGFTILSENTNGKQKVAEIFSRSNLAGKQLWYITAPASVPISAVKQVSLQDVQLGKPALSFGGREYGFVQDQVGEGGFTKVLIPEGNSDAYRIGQKAVDQTLHLQQIVQLHKTTNISSLNSSISATVTERPVRKQPKGLKMRFRPIGFGNGKTGTIGLSSSSSDASSSPDTDADEEMGDAPPVLRQPFDPDQANTCLTEHASKDSENQDDTSSSGEEADDPPRVAPADSPLGSDSSSETSNDEMGNVAKSISAPKNSSSSPRRPLKRKLSVFKKGDKTSNTIYEQFKANGMPLKTANIKNLAPAPEVSAPKVNSDARTTAKYTPSTSSSKMSQVLPPPAPETADSPVNISKPKVTPVPPPRLSSILPPGRGNKSPDVARITKAARPRPEISPVKVADTQLPSEKKTQGSLEDGHQSIDLTLSVKERKKEMRQLKKKNGVTHTSKNQRTESMNSATSDTLDRSIGASSPSQNAHQHPFKASSLTKPSAKKDSSQDAKPSRMTSTEKISKRSKKTHSHSIVDDENGGTTKPSQAASTTILLPRKESVILPPKFVRSMSR